MHQGRLHVINFHIDYFICCSFILTGVLQVSATFSGSYLFSFFSRPIINTSVAAILIATGFVLFFSTANRYINDYEGGLDGNEQAVLFLLALAFSFVVVASITSTTNRPKIQKNNSCQNHSYMCLRHDTYLNLIKSKCKFFFKESRL